MNRQEIQIKVRSAVYELIHEKGYASPLDLFIRMGKITPKSVEEWRFGRIPYLERVVHGNLALFSFIMSNFRKVAKEMDLKESHTVYMKWGKGPKHQLRFSKSGDTNVERNYSTHFIARKPIFGKPPC